VTRRAALAGAAVGLALAAAAGVAHAAPGDLDNSFGGGTGKVLQRLGSVNRGNALALQPDGKILVAGSTNSNGTPDMAVLRLTPAGVLDTSYGLGTGASAPDLGGDETANAIALQPDGKILVAGERLTFPKGQSTYEGIVARFLNPDGTFDPTYGGGGGWSLLSGTPPTQLQAIAEAPSGGIFTAGSDTNAGFSDAFVARLRNPEGTYDPAFHLNGAASLDFGGSETAYAMALQGDGKIVVVGSAAPNQSARIDLLVTRLLDPAGTLDPAFGGGAPVKIDFGAVEIARAVLLQPDGKIVVVGSTSAIGATKGAVIARVNADGTLDGGFGQGGKVTLTQGGFLDGTEAALQRDGKILVAGRVADAAGKWDFGVARLQPNGTLDATWGKNGIASADFGGDDIPGGIAVDSNGNVVVAGTRQSFDGKTADFAVARFLGDPKPPEQGGDVGVPGPPPKCGGRRATVVGTAGSDRLTGTRGADVIVAFGGNDTIRGGGGADLICAGAGNDTVFGGEGNDRVFGGDGNDRILGEGGADNLSGEAGNDRVEGGTGNDTIATGSGADSIAAGSGNDVVSAGIGNDTLNGSDGNDTLTGGPGADIFRGGSGIDTATDFNAGQGDTKTGIETF
jgi:uncharacterized delta-60 repeat protein